MVRIILLLFKASLSIQYHLYRWCQYHLREEGSGPWIGSEQFNELAATASEMLNWGHDAPPHMVTFSKLGNECLAVDTNVNEHLFSICRVLGIQYQVFYASEKGWWTVTLTKGANRCKWSVPITCLEDDQGWRPREVLVKQCFQHFLRDVFLRLDEVEQYPKPNGTG